MRLDLRASRRLLAAVAVAIVLVVAAGVAAVLTRPGGIAAPPPSAAPEARATPTVAPVAHAEVADAFDLDRARQHLAFLADPARGGRFTASPGYEEAARYVADRFREIGLEPLGDDGTYFQKFPMSLVDLAATPTLERISSAAKSYRHRSDFVEVVGQTRGSGTADGELAFVGGGNAGDYDGIDATGKLVLVAGPGEGDRVRTAIDKGAAGLLFVTLSSPIDIKFSYPPRFDPKTIPVLVVTEAVANELLAASGRRVAELRQAVEEQRRGGGSGRLAFDTGTRVRMSVPLTPVRAVEAKNVVGLLRAADPIQARRAVAVGAHLDGVGTDPSGTVFAGAVDNASGVATLIEVARALTVSRAALRHSGVFVAFAGEEEGFFGAEAYLDRMAVTPGRAESLLAYINVDSIGCCGGTLVSTEENGPLRDKVKGIAEQLSFSFSSQRSASSDQVAFARRRVPSVMVLWSDQGPIHTPRDTIERVQPDRLRDIGRVVTLLALQLARGE